MELGNNNADGRLSDDQLEKAMAGFTENKYGAMNAAETASGDPNIFLGTRVEGDMAFYGINSNDGQPKKKETQTSENHRLNNLGGGVNFGNSTNSRIVRSEDLGLHGRRMVGSDTYGLPVSPQEVTNSEQRLESGIDEGLILIDPDTADAIREYVGAPDDTGSLPYDDDVMSAGMKK